MVMRSASDVQEPYIIKIVRGTVASFGKLHEGRVLAVPDDVSYVEASLLVGFGKAEKSEAEKTPPPKRGRPKRG